MKRTINIYFQIAFFATVFTTAQTTFAQKIGYVDAAYLMANISEAKYSKYVIAQENLQLFGKKLEEEFQRKGAEFKQMMDEYEASAATMTETARKDKEEKLQKMQTDLQQFQQQAQQDIQRKEQEELKPVYDDIQTAINQIAAEQSFAFILSKDSLLFASSPESDISREVLKKMNITPKNP